MIYALDTNIVSYMIKNNRTVNARYEKVISRNDNCIIPLMVYFEIRRGLLANDAHNRTRLFENLCLDLDVEKLSVDDIDVAAKIYAERKPKGKPMYDTDLLIAAQCINRGYVLVTNNTDHFDDVEGLLVEDWTE